MMDRFNYVVCGITIDNKSYYLDASQKLLAFGHLPVYCYNGHARIINGDNPRPVYFEADSILEQTLTSVFITNDEHIKGKMDVTYQLTPGYYESYEIRQNMANEGGKALLRDIKSAYNNDIEIESSGIDSLNLLEYPVMAHYDFSFKNDTAQTLFISPPYRPPLEEKIHSNLVIEDTQWNCHIKQMKLIF